MNHSFGHQLRRWAARLVQISRHRAFRLIFRIVFALLVLFFLAFGIYANLDELQQYSWTVDIHYVVWAVLLYGVCFLTVTLAWHQVMSRVGAMSNLWANIRIFCYSCLPKRIPGAVWFVASRVHLYKEQGVARSTTLLVTALETALMIVSALVVYLLSLAFGLRPGLEERLPLGAVLLLLLPLLFLLHPAVFNRLVTWLLRRLHNEAPLSLTFGNGVRLVSIYMLAWILGGLDLYLLANAVYAVPLDLLPSMIGHWALSGALGLVASYLIQGMGISEISLAVLLSGYLPMPMAIVIVILFRILLTAGEVVCALLPLGGAALLKKLAHQRYRQHSNQSS